MIHSSPIDADSLQMIESGIIQVFCRITIHVPSALSVCSCDSLLRLAATGEFVLDIDATLNPTPKGDESFVPPAPAPLTDGMDSTGTTVTSFMSESLQATATTATTTSTSTPSSLPTVAASSAAALTSSSGSQFLVLPQEELRTASIAAPFKQLLLYQVIDISMASSEQVRACLSGFCAIRELCALRTKRIDFIQSGCIVYCTLLLAQCLSTLRAPPLTTTGGSCSTTTTTTTTTSSTSSTSATSTSALLSRIADEEQTTAQVLQLATEILRLLCELAMHSDARLDLVGDGVIPVVLQLVGTCTDNSCSELLVELLQTLCAGMFRHTHSLLHTGRTDV
jgi:hypothetical protein